MLTARLSDTAMHVAVHIVRRHEGDRTLCGRRPLRTRAGFHFVDQPADCKICPGPLQGGRPMTQLPRHLRGVHWHDKPWPDRDSPYDHGKLAVGHPNSFFEDEEGVEEISLILAEALMALKGLSGPVVPVEAAAKLARAYDCLDDVTWHLPRVEGWCVTTHSRRDLVDRANVWSAHLTRQEARSFMKLWKKQLSTRSDYQWAVVKMPARITDFVAPDAKTVIFGAYALKSAS